MIRIFKNIEEIADAIAEILINQINKEASIPFHISLSGGNTPKEIFNYLTAKYGTKLADKRFHFWWGDERCVPPTSDESNFKWAFELWLNPIGISHENIHRIRGENDPEYEAKRYSKEFSLITGNFQIDLNILGLGDDGHTASIFPNNMNLINSKKICKVATHPTSGQKRVTFTGEVLSNSKQVVFISTGEGKANIIRQIIVEKQLNYPATHVALNAKNVTWFLDEASGKLL